MIIKILDEQNANQYDINLIKVLQGDYIFEAVINSIRKQIGFPIEGCWVDISETGKLKIIGYDKEKQDVVINGNETISRGISDLIKAYNLPINWSGSLMSIIIFNASKPPAEDKDFRAIEVTYTGGFTGILRSINSDKKSPAENHAHIEIDVRQGMTFNQLIEGLKEQRHHIEKYLESLGSDPEVNKWDIEINNELVKLRREGKSYLKIAKIMDEKYGYELPFSPDRKTVKTYINRHLALLNKLRSEKSIQKYLSKYLD